MRQIDLTYGFGGSDNLNVTSDPNYFFSLSPLVPRWRGCRGCCPPLEGVGGGHSLLVAHCFSLSPRHSLLVAHCYSIPIASGLSFLSFPRCSCPRWRGCRGCCPPLEGVGGGHSLLVAHCFSLSPRHSLLVARCFSLSPRPSTKQHRPHRLCKNNKIQNWR